MFGLYREVIKCGGLVCNERYDESNRWCGSINFAGSIFPNMRNYTPNHKATSIGNQLLSNYRKFLYEYEKCYAPRDLQGMTLEEVSCSPVLNLLRWPSMCSQVWFPMANLHAWC